MKRRRINEVARCLYGTGAPVLEVAISYSYESSQAFPRAFKQLYRMIRAQFRREQQYYALQRLLQLHGLNQTESAMRELQIRQVVPRDMSIWVQLTHRAVDSFPYPGEAAYEQRLLKCMKQKGVFLASFEKTVFTAIQLQLESGQIDAPIIHPQPRCLDAVKQLIEWMQRACTSHIDLIATCSRVVDQIDVGYRRLLLEAGFVCDEELVELGYLV